MMKNTTIYESVTIFKLLTETQAKITKYALSIRLPQNLNIILVSKKSTKIFINVLFFVKARPFHILGKLKKLIAPKKIQTDFSRRIYKPCQPAK